MNYRSILVVVILLSQECFILAQDTVHVDTITIRQVGIHHSRRTGSGLGVFPTGRTMDLYEWNSKEGFNVIYRPNGVKYFEGYYRKKNDTTFVPDGYFIIYNRNSSVSREGKYEAGKLAGQWTYNDTVGNLDFVTDYKSRRKTFYHLNGVAKSEGRYKLTRPSGREFRVGIWKFYHSNGTLHCEGRLALFGKVGKWVCYNDRGEPLHTISYSRQLFRTHKSINIKDNYEEVCSCHE